MLPRAVADGGFVLALILADDMCAEPPRHLDAVKHELFHAVALGIPGAGSSSCATDKTMRSERIGLTRFARGCRFFSSESK